MATFIKLTAVTRNGLPFAKSILVNVNNIVRPVYENASNQSIIEVSEDVSYSETFTENRVTYVVSQRLTSIDALSNEVFQGTLVSYNGRTAVLPFVTGLFIKSWVRDVVQPEGSGAKFSYRVMAQKSPEEYVVTQSIDTINA